MLDTVGQRALLERDRFVDLEVPSYLYTGAHAPALASSAERLVEAYSWKSRGPGGRDAMAEAEHDARVSIAGLLRRPVDEIAFAGDASTVWSAIALGWEWKPGDNVVIHEYEHPAAYAPWLRLVDRGLEVRVVRRRDDWSMPAEDFAALCDERTTAIVTSHVGYVTGLRYDIAGIARMADARGIPVLLDASHSLGVVEVPAELCALTVSASYKWTLGPYGVGIVAWNRERLPDFVPGTAGWRSTDDMFAEDRFERWHPASDARRFQLGASAFAEIAALGAAVDEIVALGLERVERHALSLGARAIRGLAELGLVVTTPEEDAGRAGNVAFLHPDGERFADELDKRGVLLWGGDGRVRASFHVMNSAAHVDHFLEATAEILAELPVEGGRA